MSDRRAAPPKPLWESCYACRSHSTAPGLLHALASVGIERKMTTAQMASAYFRDYHEGGHGE